MAVFPPHSDYQYTGDWTEGTNPDPLIHCITLSALIQEIRALDRVRMGNRYEIAASTQIERAEAYGLPIPKWISKKFPVEPRKAWLMDYSVGGPLWAEWQRLQTHSEWDRWKDLYTEDRNNKHRWLVFYDWLLENDFPLEASEVRRWVEDDTIYSLCVPNFISVSKDPNSEPVEGTA